MALRPPQPNGYVTSAQKEEAAELRLLLELADGQKTFEMVRSDASKFGLKGKVLKQLVKSHASRGIRQRLKELTGIDREDLTHFRVE